MDELPPGAAARLEKLVPDAQTIAEFVLVSRLGEGGAAEVWRAWDRSLRRWVAIKIPQSRAGWERFVREAQAAARLHHPNLVPIHRIAEDRGRPYIVMQLVDGRNLAETTLPLRQAVEIVRTAALAVHYAHEQGVIHRDLKPGNLMLDERGGVWVLDFGLAYLKEEARELTASGAVMGTPAYMSPEQARGAPESRQASTDLYSLGATLYHLATGRAPFEGTTFAEVVRRVIDTDPPPAEGVPADLRTILQHAMEKEPSRRYPTAAAFAEDLRRFLSDEPILARPPSRMYRLVRSVKRNPALWALPFFVLLMVGATTILVRQSRDRLRRERETSVEHLRVTSRAQLETALKLRRKGQPELMRDALRPLEDAYRLASQRAKDLAELDYLMGRFHRALMDVETALRYQNQALAKDPGYRPARYERVVLNARKHYRLSQELRFRNQPAASPELEKLRAQVVEDCRTLEGAARGILAFLEGRPDEAKKILRAAVEADPLLEEAWEALVNIATAEAWYTTGDWPEVDRVATEALAHDRGYVPILLLRGNARGMRAIAGKEDDTRALDDFNEILRMDPRHVEALLWRGNLHSRRGDWKAAETDYAAALDLEADEPRALLGRGTARFHQRNYVGAIDDFSELLRSDPSNADVRLRRAQARIGRGYALQQEGRDPLPDYAAAEEDLAGGDAAALAVLGDLHWYRGTHYHPTDFPKARLEYAAAARAYEEAMKRKPELKDALQEKHHKMVEYSN